MVTSLGVNIGQLGWLKFDVTKVVSGWYTANRDLARDKLTLLVDCTGCGSRVYVSTFDEHSPHVIESSLNAKGTFTVHLYGVERLRECTRVYQSVRECTRARYELEIATFQVHKIPTDRSWWYARIQRP